MRTRRTWHIAVVVVAFLACGGRAFAANGDLYPLTHYIDPVDGPEYTVQLIYARYNDPASAGSDWEVWTSGNSPRPVPYLKLVGNDFSAQNKADMSASFEQVYASTGISTSNRVGEPSARYNCFGYALGMEEYWIESLDQFIQDEYATASISDATLASHSFRFDRDFAHASWVVRTYIYQWPTYKCQGKYGHYGIYLTWSDTPEDVYGLRYTRYWS